MDRRKKRRIARLRRLAPSLGVRSNTRKLSIKELRARTDAALFNQSTKIQEGAKEDEQKSDD